MLLTKQATLSAKKETSKDNSEELNSDIIQSLAASPVKLSPRSNASSPAKRKIHFKIDCTNMSKVQIKQQRLDNLRADDKRNIKELVKQLKQCRTSERTNQNLFYQDRNSLRPGFIRLKKATNLNP